MHAILEFQGEYRFLSNFWLCSIKIGELTFPSAEHAYQAAKSLNPRDWNLIISHPQSPKYAKFLGSMIKLRPDWEEIKLDVMRAITEAKYDQNPELKLRLLATSGRELVQGNHWGDTFWGVCLGIGQNHLGRILMEYRDQ